MPALSAAGALATDWDTLWLFMDDRDDGNVRREGGGRQQDGSGASRQAGREGL